MRGVYLLCLLFFVSNLYAFDGPLVAAFDFRETPLVDVSRAFTMQTGKNITVSPSIRSLPITLYLQGVSARTALETLCKSYGLWYTEEGNVVRLMPLEEFSRGLTFGSSDEVRRIPLRYASSLAIAELIQSLYGDRIVYTPPSSAESFSHVGTDGFPQIGSSASRGGGASRQTTTVARRGTQVQGELSVSADDVERAVRSSGKVSDDEIRERGTNRAPVYLTVYLRENSIIMRSVDRKMLDEAVALIGELDTPTRQVLLEMRILEVSLMDGAESFVDLSLTPGGKLSNGVNSGSSTGITGVNTVNQGGIAGSTFRMGYVSDLLSARLELYEGENRVRRIGSPLMLCANNASARLFQGVNTPVRQGYSVVTAKNIEGFITNEFIEVQMSEEEIGVGLQISPSINEDRTVTLKINADISTLLMGGGPEVPYVVGNNQVLGQTDAVRRTSIQAIVAAVDGQSVALGGLIEEAEIDNERRVPLLGRIPGIRFFFRSREQRRERKEIVFLIRPHIMASPAEGDSINNEFFRGRSAHPVFTDSVETLLNYDKGSNLLVSTTPLKGDLSSRVVDIPKPKQPEVAERFERLLEDTLSMVDAPKDTVFIVEEEEEVVEESPKAEELSPLLRGFLLRWSRSWSTRDMESYLSFYSHDFRSGRRDLTEWAQAKEDLFDRVEFISVSFDDIKVTTVSDNLLEVEFTQFYRSDIYSDNCRKRLLLRKMDGDWLIVREEIVPGTEEVVETLNHRRRM